ncbi:hypothetical protein EV359DRAFT_68423 [Lentinula novae-zelandiae]|nr:hypothetical protein EV359DRAFT_68423 [Lentinula novae-zelandiae]
MRQEQEKGLNKFKIDWVESHLLRIKNNGETNSRHMKLQSRCKICVIMLRECRNRDNQEGVKFFSFCLRAFEKMGSGGMSEDEDGVDKVHVEKRELEEAVKLIMFLPFCHSTLTKLVVLMDEIPQTEGLKKLFVQSGRVRKRRVRGDPRLGEVALIKESIPPVRYRDVTELVEYYF